MEPAAQKFSPNAWPFFLVAAFVLLGSPYPDLTYSIFRYDNGNILVAKIGLFISVLSIAVWVKQGAVGTAPATRLVIVAYFGIYAFFSPLALALARLAPLLVFAVGHWRGLPDVSSDSWLAKIPSLVRELIAFLFALLSSGCVSAGLDMGNGWDFDQINYALLWIGLNFAALSSVIMLTQGTKRNFINAAIIGYGLTLTLACLIAILATIFVQISATATLPLPICAMMLLQVWRHFYREDAWLKILETFLGGIILFAGLALIGSTIDKDGWFILFFFISFPLIAAGAALALFGLKLIWTKDIWLRRKFEDWQR
jgi:hypothetical protein